MSTAAEIHDEERPPPLPDVPFVIGIHAGDGLRHAVARRNAVRSGDMYGDIHPSLVRIGAECGACVTVARRWGEFRRGNEHVDRSFGQLCPECAWTVALYHGTEDAELAAIIPTGGELEALQRLLPDAGLFGQLCRRILDDRASGRDYDADHGRWPQWLGHATRHQPVVLLDVDCIEQDCEHADPDGQGVLLGGCYDAATVVACRECSLRAGPWAGEYEGQFEVTAPAPCAALSAMSRHYEARCTGGAA